MADEALNQEPESQPEAAAERSLSLLASEKFGRDFHGDAPDPVETKVEIEEVEEDEPEGIEEPAAREDPQVETEEPEEVSISSLQELMEQNEYDPEWVQSLKIPVKINGESGEAPLAELVKSYQIGKATEAELTEAKSKSKAALEELNRQKETLAESLQMIQSIVADEEAAIERELKNTDWAKLREDDPAEAVARKDDIKERREALQAKKQKAVDAYKKAAEVQQEQVQQNLRQLAQTERAKLLEKIPEWRDPEKAKAEDTKLCEYLIGQGYTKQEIANAYDHRLVVGLRKAMLWDEMQSKSNAAKKKVAKVPRVLKPGAQKPKDQIDQERAKQARQKLRKSGNIDDAYALLKARRGN